MAANFEEALCRPYIVVASYSASLCKVEARPTIDPKCSMLGNHRALSWRKCREATKRKPGRRALVLRHMRERHRVLGGRPK